MTPTPDDARTDRDPEVAPNMPLPKPGSARRKLGVGLLIAFWVVTLVVIYVVIVQLKAGGVSALKAPPPPDEATPEQTEPVPVPEVEPNETSTTEPVGGGSPSTDP
jgi:hypothetical protein